MHTTLRRRDVVYKAVAVVVVGVVVLHRNLDIYVADVAFAVDDVIVQCGIALVQVLHVLLDAALVVEGFFAGRLLAEIGERDFQALGEERHLAETLLQGIEVKYNLIENRGIREERDG